MAIVACLNGIVILNLFQYNKPPQGVILKQNQGDKTENVMGEMIRMTMSDGTEIAVYRVEAEGNVAVGLFWCRKYLA